MALERSQVAHVARLARLSLTEDEMVRLTGELDAILDWVRKLEEIDVDDVPPMAHVVSMPAPLRADEVEVGLTADEATDNAPERLGGQVVVPKVV